MLLLHRKLGLVVPVVGHLLFASGDAPPSQKAGSVVPVVVHSPALFGDPPPGQTGSPTTKFACCTGTVHWPPEGALPSGQVDWPGVAGTVHWPPEGALPSGQVDWPGVAGTVHWPPEGALPSGQVDWPGVAGTVHWPPEGALPSGQVDLCARTARPGSNLSGGVLSFRPGMKGNIGSCRLSVTALSLDKDVASLENRRWESGKIFAIVFPGSNE